MLSGIVTAWAQDSRLILGLLDAGFKSLLILAGAAAICAGWRGASAATRHYVWLVAMATLLFLPAWSFHPPTWARPWCSLSASLEPGNQIALALDFSKTVTRSPAPALHLAGAGPGARPTLTPARDPHLTAYFNAGGWQAIPVIWCTGLILVVASGMIGRLLLWQTCRRAAPLVDSAWQTLLHELRRVLGIRRPVRLLQSADHVIPITWGWLRPIVLLPAQANAWSADRREIVLCHELAHIKRCDCCTQTLAGVVGALYWFNPLAWVALRRMRLEREQACDDLVLGRGCKPSEYAGHLVAIARTLKHRPQVRAIPMARPSGLQQRVVSILDPHRNRTTLAKLSVVLVALGVIGIMCFAGGCTTTTQRSTRFVQNSETGPQFRAFVAEKEAQAIAGAKAEDKEMLPEYQSLFAAAASGDWLTVSNIWEDLRKRAPQYEGSGPKDERLHGTAWQTILETWAALGNLELGREPLATLGQAVVQSIPPGSIYFGGTDPGRCVITALQKSHVQADPFYTLTQNALADASYLQYLRTMYGHRIYIPTDSDSKRAFDEYVADAEQRLKAKLLKPGEDLKYVDGKAHVSGQVAVMAINGLLAKIIFDRNPNLEFYVEESFPLDWMYPHLSPHGPILKVHREPLNELSLAMLQRDREYWKESVAPLIGNWLEMTTPLAEVAAFTEKPVIVSSKSGRRVTPYAQKWASKLRSSIAGVYAWRMQNATTAQEKERMGREADFAFRQAFAVSPTSPEAVFRYANLLLHEKRTEDAALLAKTAAKLAPKDTAFANLVKEIDRLQTGRPK